VYQPCLASITILLFFYNKTAGLITFFLLTSWICQEVLDGPLWQISCMIFLYLLYSFVLPFLQKILERLDYLQFLIYFVLFITLNYDCARGMMSSRLPVFVMGILLGLERLHPSPPSPSPIYLECIPNRVVLLAFFSYY
jgi:hypothetical protein